MSMHLAGALLRMSNLTDAEQLKGAVQSMVSTISTLNWNCLARHLQPCRNGMRKYVAVPDCNP